MKKIKTVSHNEMLDKHIGKNGTKERDKFEKKVSKDVASYKTKVKQIRISNELLSKLKGVAEKEGVSDTKVIERALESYFNGNEHKIKVFLKTLLID